MLGITDKPIDKISEDMFNMNAQIKGLCNYIKKCDTPMTISIQGDWGSGKTSLMNMVKSEIESDVCSIWFNAWQFSQFNLKDELSTSLISYLLHELGENKESINKTIGIISGTSKLISQIMTASFLGKDASDTIGEWFGSHTLNSAGEIKGLKDKFQKAVESKLKKEKKSKAVIYIDDLDRLQPEKSVELLEVIKMFLDCESCVFILAIDYEVVTQGLSQKYGENIGAEKGKEYFDKFIHLSFDMPIKERMYDVGNYLSNLMPELIGVEIPPDNYINALNYSIGYNPRGIKRFSNMYMLYLSIIKELRSSLDEETKMILFMLLCMKIAYEEVFNYIINLGIEAKSSLIDELINEMYEDQFLIEDIQNYTEQKKEKLLSFLILYKNYIPNDYDRDLRDIVSVIRTKDGNGKFNRMLTKLNMEIVDEINAKIQEKFDCSFIAEKTETIWKYSEMPDIYSVCQFRKETTDYKFAYRLINTQSITERALIFYLSPVNVGERESLAKDFSGLCEEDCFGDRYEKTVTIKCDDEKLKVSNRKMKEYFIREIGQLIENKLKFEFGLEEKA